jgi:hypothetical protein
MIAARQALRGAFTADSEAPADDRVWEQLARAALALAVLVSARRSVQAMLAIQEKLEGVAGEIDAFAERAWSAVEERDVVLLARAAVADHAFARDAEGLAVNPTFALCARLGGADADLVAGGTLWDFKSSAQTRVIRREELWQLLGYALADTDDRYALHSVGFSALRWRRRWSLPIDEVIARLQGPEDSRSRYWSGVNNSPR